MAHCQSLHRAACRPDCKCHRHDRRNQQFTAGARCRCTIIPRQMVHDSHKHSSIHHKHPATDATEMNPLSPHAAGSLNTSCSVLESRPYKGMDTAPCRPTMPRGHSSGLGESPARAEHCAEWHSGVPEATTQNFTHHSQRNTLFPQDKSTSGCSCLCPVLACCRPHARSGRCWWHNCRHWAAVYHTLPVGGQHELLLRNIWPASCCRYAYSCTEGTCVLSAAGAASPPDPQDKCGLACCHTDNSPARCDNLCCALQLEG